MPILLHFPTHISLVAIRGCVPYVQCKSCPLTYKIKHETPAFSTNALNMIRLNIAIAIILIINATTPGILVLKTIISLGLTILATIIAAIATQQITTHKTNRPKKQSANNDYTMVRQYLRQHNLLKKESLNSIKMHYLIKSQKQTPSYYMEITLTIITIATSFISSREITPESLTKSILISAVIAVGLLIICFTIKSYYNYYKFFTGDDDLYETLEDITTRLYLETTQKDKSN